MSFTISPAFVFGVGRGVGRFVQVSHGLLYRLCWVLYRFSKVSYTLVGFCAIVVKAVQAPWGLGCNLLLLLLLLLLL